MKFIAELCQNHNGSYENLRKMTIECAKNGADIIKLQYITPQILSFRPQFENGLFKKNKTISIKRPYKAEWRRLNKLMIKKKFLIKFVKLCKSLKKQPAITCFSRQDVNEIKKLGFKIIKIASYDCASFQLLRDIKKKFKKIIISTGATYDCEIEKASSILKGEDFVLLHCVTIYPTPLKKINLNRINLLKKFSKKCGFSDHTLGYTKNKNLASMAAIYMGAEYVERHITILDKDTTKDGNISIRPQDIKILKDFSKLNKKNQFHYIKENFNINLQALKGKKLRQLSQEEILNRDYYRGRFVSKKKNREIYNWEEIDLK
jgi:sialic acid synthase SpsE